MHSHIIELSAKPGQASLLISAIRDHAIPEIITPAEGFVGQIVLQSSVDPDLVTSISFWESKEFGDLFLQNGFTRVGALTAPFVSMKPRSYEFSVELSTFNQIRRVLPQSTEFGDCD